MKDRGVPGPVRFSNGALAAALLLAVAAAPAAEVLNVRGLMEKLGARQNAVEAALLGASAADRGRVDRDLADMDDIFGALEELYRPFYRGDEGHWKAFCASGRTIVADTRRLMDDDLAGARGRFRDLSVLREKAHAEFRPGLFRRIAAFFRKNKGMKEEVK